ncbi:hypothetical protein ACFW1A_23635 [Kitasatospora sp. NPDC058965]|uniref:hypothetical protein n=1 Tax=Kitasatospora sp. NPDC058965 TaxID=3346682 RepID=UPI0036AC32E3
MEKREIKQSVAGLLSIVLDDSLDDAEFTQQFGLVTAQLLAVSSPRNAPAQAAVRGAVRELEPQLTSLTAALCEAFRRLAVEHDRGADASSREILQSLALEWSAEQ